MRLIKVSATGDGVKGATFSDELSPVTLYVGPNGSGKTRRLLTVNLALLGLANVATDPRKPYLGPDRPKTKVSLEFDNGTTVTRPLKPTRGKVVSAADHVVDSRVGAVVRWDLEDFASGKDSARVQLLEQVTRSGGGGPPPDLGEVMVRLSDGGDEAVDTLVQQLFDAVPFPATVTPNTHANWMASALEWAGEKYTETNALRKQHKAAALAPEPDEDMPLVFGTTGTADARIADLDAQILKIEKDLASTDSKMEAVRQHNDAVEDLRALVATHASSLEEASKRLDDQRARASAHDAAKPHPWNAAEQQRLDDLTAAAGVLITSVAEQTSALDKADDDFNNLSGRLEQLTALASEGDHHCRACGVPNPLGLDKRVGALREQMFDAEDDRIDRQIALRKLADTADSAASDRDRLAEEKRQRQDAMTAWESRVKDLDNAVDLAAAAVRHHETQHSDASAKLEKRRLSKPQSTMADGALLGDQLQALRRARQQEADKREQLIRQQERKAGTLDHVAARADADAAWERVVLVGKRLRAIQEEVASSATAPIAAAANSFMEEILEPARVFVHGQGLFGLRWPDGREVPFWSLADSERGVAAAAMVVAFATVGDQPWRAVILDRMEALDPTRMWNILHAASRMVSTGRLDNFIGAARMDEPVPDSQETSGIDVRWLETEGP